ncbi:tryptophan-rich sensory protein [Amycolatopsis thermoflava]|uniref:tryptophan-rich sensory protein n=1 Tax=Amycolatopsis thermoflava TaxID=84480 RepID=UPI0037F4B859
MTGWAPPAGAFGPVWTTAVRRDRGRRGRLWTRRAGATVLGLHAVQLALNASWPPAFFTLRKKKLSLAVVAALDAAVAAEIAAAARRDHAAAGLLAPYLAWSLDATALTAAVGDPGGAS